MKRARTGRAGVFSFGLVVGFLLLGYAALRLLELAPRSSPAASEGTVEGTAEGTVEGDGASTEITGGGVWRAFLTLGEAKIQARLLPLHDEPALEEFRASALGRRYGLPAGKPWRLYLSLEEPAAQPLSVRAVRVRGLAPFAELARPLAELDPVHALLSSAPGVLTAGEACALVLWGNLSAAGAELELDLEGAGDTQRAVAALEQVGKDESVALAPRWFAGQAPPGSEGRSLEQEVARLERELEHERARRAERELAILEFSRVLAKLPGAEGLGLGSVAAAPAPPNPEEDARRSAAAAERARAQELGRALRVLMRLEGLRGLDLLEAGTLQPGPPSAIGPVVFRCLDERGLLTGSLGAERLRLSASVSAHTLTLILEDGFESRGGERVPFEHGVRRITLSDVDPEPWIAECPELFGPAELARANDDGRWVLSELRRELNRLLALDPRLGWYRLHSLGGVLGSELRDVQLEQLAPDGRVERRLFADGLTLALEDGSLVLELRDGAFVRGQEKQPFQGGRHRIVLPGVPLEAWRASPLPGLSAPPAREKPAEPGAAGG